jgi:hypothetical protein
MIVPSIGILSIVLITLYGWGTIDFSLHTKNTARQGEALHIFDVSSLVFWLVCAMPVSGVIPRSID